MAPGSLSILVRAQFVGGRGAIKVIVGIKPLGVNIEVYARLAAVGMGKIFGACAETSLCAVSGRTLLCALGTCSALVVVVFLHKLHHTKLVATTRKQDGGGSCDTRPTPILGVTTKAEKVHAAET